MSESFARKLRTDLEETRPSDPKLPEIANDNEAVAPAHIIHPETANDNESSQPISTIYSESVPTQDVAAEILAESTIGTNGPLPEAMNDNQRIAVLKEKLRTYAETGEDEGDEALEVPVIENEEELASETATEAVPGHSNTESHEKQPNPAQAAGGAEKKDDGGDGKGPKKPDLSVHEGGGGHKGEKRKNPFMLFLQMFGYGLMAIVGAVVWAETTIVRKVTDNLLKSVSGKGGGGHGPAPKKKADAGHGGGHGGGGHH